MQIEELFEKLKNLKYEYEGYSGGKYTAPVIKKEEFRQVELVIRQYLLDQYNSEVGELKAKVYAYEMIIANSNFAPILQTKLYDEVEESEVGESIRKPRKNNIHFTKNEED